MNLIRPFGTRLLMTANPALKQIFRGDDLLDILQTFCSTR